MGATDGMALVAAGETKKKIRRKEQAICLLTNQQIAKFQAERAHRITCTVDEACFVSGLSPTTIFALIREKGLDSVLIGRRRLVKMESLIKLLEGRS